MTTPLSQGQDVRADRSLFGSDRRRRRTGNNRVAARQRDAEATAAPVLNRDSEEVHAAWSSERGRCELVVRSGPAGIQIKQRTSLHSGTILEEGFVIHSRAEFEQWHANAPTKFDHPVAHDEIRRFAHGTLAE